MHDQRKLTELTTSIYDAALDPALWPEVLAAIAEFAGGQVGGLLVKENGKRNINVHFHAGIDDYYLQLYADTYSQLGPIANAPCCDVEQILSVTDLMPYDDFRRGRFYQEWAEPQGWADAAMIALVRSPVCCAYLSIARHEASGLVDSEMRRRSRSMSMTLTNSSSLTETTCSAMSTWRWASSEMCTRPSMPSWIGWRGRPAERPELEAQPLFSRSKGFFEVRRDSRIGVPGSSNASRRALTR